MIEGKPLSVERIVQHVTDRRTHLSNRSRNETANDQAKTGAAIRELTKFLDWIEEHQEAAPAPPAQPEQPESKRGDFVIVPEARVPTLVIERMLTIIPADQIELRGDLQAILLRYDFLLLPEDYGAVWRQGASVLLKAFRGGPPPTGGWQAQVEAIWFDKEPPAS